MCGVFGIFGFDRHHITPDKLREIGQGILFRGPDNHGQFLDKRVAIGFQRLSIIDSDGGNQPIYNEDKTLVMFCNGEIYNYANLREKLILRGHNFRTASDSEVIVHLYEEYGLDCVEHLNGMFAFVIYDTEQNTLWLVRDRLGIKPLYYFVNNENFVFGSSIDSITEFIGKQPVSRESIYSYLLTSYIPAPMTIYENIKKVMPGEHVLVSLGGVKLERYWIPDGDDEQTEDISEINSHLMTLVMDSVNLESNVNKDIGLSLSGGLDSSMIAVLAKKNKKIESLKTYTIDFYGKNGTDAVASQTVAQFVGTQHKTTRICVVEQLASLSQLIRMLDEPMADSALIPTYLVAKQAKADGLNVMLSGAGSDEIFAGYARHDIDAFLSPAWISTLPKCILLGFCKAIALFDRNKAFRISSPSNNFAMSISGVDVELLSEIIKDDKFIKKADRYFRRTFPANRKTSLHDLLLLDVLNYLPNNILPLLDKATMAASVEGRVPFLDHRVVELALKLSKIAPKTRIKDKFFLRSWANRLLPEGIVQRRKEGFNAPVKNWVNDTGDEIYEELIENTHEIITEMFDMKKLGDYLSSGNFGANASQTIYSLFILNKWLREKQVNAVSAKHKLC